MNIIWSEHVQGIMMLYFSRKLRFDDMFSRQYKNLFHLDHSAKLRILEIGCGQGALAELKYGDLEKKLCMDIAGHFAKVSETAREMMSLLGDWGDVEKIQKHFGDRSVRENWAR